MNTDYLAILEKIMHSVRAFYPDLNIVLWIKDERAKLIVDGSAIVKYLNVDLLIKQLSSGGEDAENDMIKYICEYVEHRYIKKKKYYKRTNEKRGFTESQILYAISNTQSNIQAAKFLGCSLNTYKKYAKLYDLYEKHKSTGKSIKRKSQRPQVPLDSIFENKHPTYNIETLKNRLIYNLILPEMCEICGYNQERQSDRKVALQLDFRDNNRKNMQLENLRLICYNCMFTYKGKMYVGPKSSKSKEMINDVPTDNTDITFEKFNKK